ncbi:MAG TPA: 3-isopropylmalate dehydratase small subunit [Synergistales bacterium]|nr:3-isopropylmalate dehydratase small subunit [Synergistales bacterium]
MTDLIMGKAWVFGDHIDTDVIIPARYLVTNEEKELGKHCMEDMDPSFTSKIIQGDIIVAGENFGCGSSREHAPLAIKGAGISCVIASSFARIFFRNAINIGLPIFVCPEAVRDIASGDKVSVTPSTGSIRNETRKREYTTIPFSPFLQELIEAGGLTPFVRKKLEKKRQG